MTKKYNGIHALSNNSIGEQSVKRNNAEGARGNFETNFQSVNVVSKISSNQESDLIIDNKDSKKYLKKSIKLIGMFCYFWV